jgi:hypothetical protein
MNHPETAVLLLGRENADFNHPNIGFNRCPTYDHWDAVEWLGSGDKPTRAELEAVPVPEEDILAAQLEALRQPVVVEGVTFPVLRADMGFYAAVWVSRDNAETSYPLPLIGDDGVLVATNSSDVDRVYRAINQAISDRASND